MVPESRQQVAHSARQDPIHAQFVNHRQVSSSPALTTLTRTFLGPHEPGRLHLVGSDRTTRFNPTGAIQSRPKPGKQNPDGCVTSNVRSRLTRLTSERFQPLELVFIPGDAEPRALRADNGAIGDL